jgi:hypothetical protein
MRRESFNLGILLNSCVFDTLLPKLTFTRRIFLVKQLIACKYAFCRCSYYAYFKKLAHLQLFTALSELLRLQYCIIKAYLVSITVVGIILFFKTCLYVIQVCLIAATDCFDCIRCNNKNAYSVGKFYKNFMYAIIMVLLSQCSYNIL